MAQAEAAEGTKAAVTVVRAAARMEALVVTAVGARVVVRRAAAGTAAEAGEVAEAGAAEEAVEGAVAATAAAEAAAGAVEAVAVAAVAGNRAILNSSVAAVRHH